MAIGPFLYVDDGGRDDEVGEEFLGPGGVLLLDCAGFDVGVPVFNKHGRVQQGEVVKVCEKPLHVLEVGERGGFADGVGCAHGLGDLGVVEVQCSSVYVAEGTGYEHEKVVEEALGFEGHGVVVSDFF